MVARKKKENPIGGLAVLAISLMGIIILLLTFLAIFALVGAWLYFEQAIRKYQGAQGREDFKLTLEDQQTLHKYTQAKTQIASRLNEIYELRHSLPLKTDGSFDSRNKEGRSLNSELQTLRSELEECDRTIDHLSTIEESDYCQWVTVRSGLYASRAAMLALPLIALALFQKTPQFVTTLSGVVEKTTGLASVGGVGQFYGILSTTAGVVTVMFLLTWGVGRWVALQPTQA